MIARKHLLAAFCAASSLSAGSALAQDAKNPLVPPSKEVAANPGGQPASTGGPAPESKLPPPASAAGPAAGHSAGSSVGAHLAGLNVVAIIGDKAILRGPVGKGSSFAIVGGAEGDVSKDGHGAASVQRGGSQDVAKSSAVTLVIKHAQPLQLAEGIWVRPDVSGMTVRLFQQPSNGKSAGAASEILVYAASLDTLSPTAPIAADKGDDAQQDDKK